MLKGCVLCVRRGNRVLERGTLIRQCARVYGMG